MYQISNQDGLIVFIYVAYTLRGKKYIFSGAMMQHNSNSKKDYIKWTVWDERRMTNTHNNTSRKNNRTVKSDSKTDYKLCSVEENKWKWIFVTNTHWTVSSIKIWPHPKLKLFANLNFNLTELLHVFRLGLT